MAVSATVFEYVIIRRVIRDGKATDLFFNTGYDKGEMVAEATKHAHVNGLQLQSPGSYVGMADYNAEDIVFGNPNSDGLVVFVRKSPVTQAPVRHDWLKSKREVIPFFEGPGRVSGKETKFSLNIGPNRIYFYEDTFAKAAIEKIFNTKVSKVYTTNPGRYEKGTYSLDKHGTLILHLDGSVVVGGKMGIYNKNKANTWTYIRGPRKKKYPFQYGIVDNAVYEFTTEVRFGGKGINLKSIEVLLMAERLVKEQGGQIIELTKNKLRIQINNDHEKDTYSFTLLGTDTP